MEKLAVGGIEHDVLVRAKREPPATDAHLPSRPHRGEHRGEGRRVAVEVVAGEPGGHRGIGEVPAAGEGEAAPQDHPQPTPRKPPGGDEIAEVTRGAERTDRVGRAGSETHLEEREHARDVHRPIPRCPQWAAARGRPQAMTREGASGRRRGTR